MKRCTTCMAYRRRHLYYFWRCSRNKDSLRNTCKACDAQSSVEWRKAHPERTNALYKAFRDANPEEARVRVRQWRANNLEKALAASRSYQAEHRKERRKYLAEWHKKHPTKKRDYTRTREARKRGVGIIEPIALDIVYIRDKRICSLCHQHVKREEASIDHVIPLSKGGAHSWQNVTLAHRLCNARKSHRVITQQQRLF